MEYPYRYTREIVGSECHGAAAFDARPDRVVLALVDVQGLGRPGED